MKLPSAKKQTPGSSKGKTPKGGKGAEGKRPHVQVEYEVETEREPAPRLSASDFF